MLASVLVMAILVEIWRDRRNRSATTSVLAAALLLMCALAGLAWGDRHVDEGRVVAGARIVARS